MDIVTAKINRIVVVLHAGCLKKGEFFPITFSDAYGVDNLEYNKKDNLEAGAILLYDGPPNMDPLNHQGDNDKQVFFYEHEFYCFSNFSAFRLKWKDVDFDTSEVAYHWEKFPDREDVRRELVLTRSAHEALKLAEYFKGLRRSDWDDVKVGIMKEILYEKMIQHPYVLKKLIETGNRELIEDSWRDRFWGWGPDRTGNNMLGKLWMQIRKELK